MKKLLLLTLLSLSAFGFSQPLNEPADLFGCSTANSAQFDLTPNIATVLGDAEPENFNVTFHVTQADALNDANPIANTAAYTNITNPQQIFIRIENIGTSESIVSAFSITVSHIAFMTTIAHTICETDNDGITYIDLGSLAEMTWMNTQTNPNSTEITFYGSMADATLQQNPLPWGSYYNLIPDFQTIYVRAQTIGTECFNISEINLFIVHCDPQSGFPVNLEECEAENGLACFDLTVNNANVLGTLVASEYTISYYTSQSDATAEVNPISNATSYCISFTMESPTIFVRLENNETGISQIMTFGITAREYLIGAGQVQPLIACDDDADGTVIFDLTVVEAPLGIGNPVQYFTDSNDMMSLTNPISNPAAYNISVATPFLTIFAREIVTSTCDVVYSIPVYAAADCNTANSCAGANSLCNSLGEPFLNSVNLGQAEPWNNYGCLQTTPNPTWFYLPVGTAGPITLLIEQNSSIDFNQQQLDVDYVCFGPFADPVSPCGGMLSQNNIVSCSFSTSASEMATIPNAQTGQFYLIMVTNFSNQPGYIRITQISGGGGEINCTGLRLNAFLDSNSNGVKDSGEQNFPLGQFSYEANDDSVIHNVTSPSGIYSIYDDGDNSFDVGYSIDPAYAANYSLTTAAYSDITVVPGTGMQEYFFPVTVSQPYSDLAVSIIPEQAPRPGFPYVNKVIYSNFGNQAMSGTVSFTKDPLVSITSISEPAAITTATGFTHDFTNLLPFESREITVTMQVPALPVVNIGNLLVSNANIIPLAGDVAPENNEASCSQVVMGAFDPNDKIESHGGQILISDFTDDDYLYYTIRFENTGNASAINVRVEDMLDSRLDETSIRMVDASHDYIMDRIDNNVNWTFDNIQLPPAGQDPNGAKGYITFKVKPDAGYAVGDIIPNTASIYFDFNPAIVTNTFNTEFVTILATSDFENGGFAIYPNPAQDIVTILMSDSIMISEIAIYDMLGKQVLVKHASSASETIDVSQIGAGMYFVEITAGKDVKSTRKLIVE